jgi:ribosomal protein L7/L12
MKVKLSGEAFDQIFTALQRDDVAAASKIYRVQTNCSLAEAKRAAEQLHMEAKRSKESSSQFVAALKRDDIAAAVKNYQEQANCSLAVAQQAVERWHKKVKLSESVSQFLAALKRNDVVAAIKIYREQQNCSLAEAKRDVEQLHKVVDMFGAAGSSPGEGASANISAIMSDSGLTINNVKIPADIAAKIQAALQSGDESAVIDMLQNACKLDWASAKNTAKLIGKMRALAQQGDTEQFQAQDQDDERDKTAAEVVSVIRSIFEDYALETDADRMIIVNDIEVPDDLVEKIRIALQDGNESEVLKILHDTCNLDLNGATNSVSVGAATGLTNQSHKKQLKARDAAKPQPRSDTPPSSSQIMGAGDSPYGNVLMLVSLIVLVAVAAWWFFSQ